MEREVGGGIGMGNTCKSMADSFQCMTKPTTIKFKKIKKKKNTAQFTKHFLLSTYYVQARCYKTVHKT